MFPNPPFSSGSPERVRSSTGHGWTRGSPPSFLSSKAGGRAFPVLTLPVPRPACLQGGALGPSHSVMQTASCHCLALFKGTAAGVLRADYVEVETTLLLVFCLKQNLSRKPSAQGTEKSEMKGTLRAEDFPPRALGHTVKEQDCRVSCNNSAKTLPPGRR